MFSLFLAGINSNLARIRYMLRFGSCSDFASKDSERKAIWIAEPPIGTTCMQREISIPGASFSSTRTLRLTADGATVGCPVRRGRHRRPLGEHTCAETPVHPENARPIQPVSVRRILRFLGFSSECLASEPAGKMYPIHLGGDSCGRASGKAGTAGGQDHRVRHACRGRDQADAAVWKV